MTELQDKEAKVRAELPDPVALIQQAISADLDSSVFNEQQFPTAPNVIEWCRGTEWLNSSTDLFPKQVEVLARFFEDVCYQCSDVDYIHNVPVDANIGDVLDRFTLLNRGVCPQCGRNRTEILDEWIKDSRYGKFHNWDASVVPRPVPPNEFTGIWGQRSGKSITVAAFIFPYLLHRWLALPNLCRYYRMPSTVVLEAAFVSPTLRQINQHIWMPFRNAFDNSPWFRNMVDYLKDESNRTGLQLYHAQQTFIIFPGKRLAVHILAANSSTLRGGTRVMGAVDEAGWFSASEDGKVTKGARDGVEVFTSLNNSLRTVRTRAEKRRATDFDAIDGYMVNISSPSSISDPIEQRAAVAPKSFRMFFTRYATWEVNKDEDETLIREEFAGNPLKFKRDFCAQPPRASHPYFENDAILKDIVAPNQNKLFEYEIKTEEAVAGKVLRPCITKHMNDSVIPRILAVDNGEKKNSFGLCVARYYPEQEGVLFEEFVEVSPYPDIPIDLAWCYNEFIVPLVKTYRFQHVVYDRWESGYAVADLRSNHNVDAQRYSSMWPDFASFRDGLLGTRIWLPQPECDPMDLLKMQTFQERAKYPRAHFQAQLLTVNEFGKRLEKPDQGNDDLFRTAVLAYRFITKYKDLYRHNVVEGPKFDQDRPVAMFFGRSQRQVSGASGSRIGVGSGRLLRSRSF
ncbi:MAG: hypothetical protein WC505_06675 [Patescibacteria group bacterium]